MTYRSIRSAAGELGVSQQLLRRAIRRGSIPAVEIAGAWRIPPSYFEELEARAFSRVAGDEVRLSRSGSPHGQWPRKRRWHGDDAENAAAWDAKELERCPEGEPA